MVRKTKILSLFLLPSALIIFLTGWCLQFIGEPKRGGPSKKQIYDVKIGVLQSDEQWICQPIRG
jgi:hypothetical protein